MGRPRRVDEAGAIGHMLNRANRRATIFRIELRRRPNPRKPDWLQWIRQPLSVQEQCRLRGAHRRGRPTEKRPG